MNDEEKLNKLEAEVKALAAQSFQLNQYTNESLDNIRQALGVLIQAAGAGAPGLSMKERDRLTNLISKGTALKNASELGSGDRP